MSDPTALPPPPPPGSAPRPMSPPQAPRPAPTPFPQPAFGAPGAPGGRPPSGPPSPPQGPTATPGGPSGPKPPWWSRRAAKLPVIAWIALVAVVAIVVGVVVTTSGDDNEATPDRTVVEDTRPDPDDTRSDDTRPDDTDPTVTEPDETAPPATEPDDTRPSFTLPPGTVPPATRPPTTEVDTPSVQEAAGSPAGERGTADAPVAVGNVADIGGGWRLQVLDLVADATALVAEANEYNEPPPAGSQFSYVTIALGYYGLDDPQVFFNPTIRAFGASGTALEQNCGSIGGEIGLFDDAFAGGVATGNLCFVTEAADIPLMQLTANASFVDDDVILAIGPSSGAATMPTLAGPQEGAVATPSRIGAAAIGTAADIGAGWQFTVDSAGRDITDQMLADFSYNEPPPEGFRYVGVDVTFTYGGTESTGQVYDVNLYSVGAGNVQRSSLCGTVTNEPDLFAELASGDSMAATVCFVVPVDEISSLVVYATATYEVEPVYFTTS